MATKTLTDRFGELRELYGYRNAMYMQGSRRADFLNDACLYLQRLIRKGEKDKVVLTKAMASLFARACAYADSFENLPIVAALALKYPGNSCAYCKTNPCVCSKVRTSDQQFNTDSSMLGVPGAHSTHPAYMNWSVTDWCTSLERMYGKNNRERGILDARSRLIEEVFEAENAHFNLSGDPRITLVQLRENMSLEFADIFAWIFSICNLLEVDLDTELEHRYAGNCRHCNKRPCLCGPFTRHLPGTSSPRVSTVRSN